MRIAYVSLQWPRSLNSGVGKKIASQVAAWRKCGHPCQLFMHMHAPDQDDLVPGERFIYLEKKGLPGRLFSEINRSRALTAMLTSLRRFAPEIIYLRMSMYTYPVHRLAAIAPFVMEINTNDVQEHRRLGGILNLYNRLTRSIHLGRSSGLVTVTGELAQSHDFTRYKKPIRVIANGIDLDSLPMLPAPHNKRPRIAFIGSPGMPWHGSDKLVGLANACPDIAFDVIGYDHMDTGGELPSNLLLHGYRKEYLDILSQADAALGSMALHRNGLQEASPLKVRECLAYGLPVILPYRDSDLYDLQCSFILTLPNHEKNMLENAQKVRAFVYSVRGQRADRALLEPLIGSVSKEQARLAFFQSVLEMG